MVARLLQVQLKQIYDVAKELKESASSLLQSLGE